MNRAAMEELRADAVGSPTAAKQKLHKVIVGEAVINLAFEHQTDQERVSRRRMLWFLVYDLIVFSICLGLTAWAIFDNLVADNQRVSFNDVKVLFTNPNWRFAATLYWVKALYGLLSFPFLLLVVPGVGAVVSHARPTGYNPWGNTVPYRCHEEELGVTLPWRPAPAHHVASRDANGDLETPLSEL
jgi:hypothetical protein